MSNEPVNVVIGDLSSMDAEVQDAFAPAIADSFLEAAVNADKRRLEMLQTEFSAGDPTTLYLLDHGYMRVVASTGVMIVFEITDEGMRRGAEVVAAKAAKP